MRETRRQAGSDLARRLPYNSPRGVKKSPKRLSHADAATAFWGRAEDAKILCPFGYAPDCYACGFLEEWRRCFPLHCDDVRLQCDDVRLQCDDAGFNGAMSACIATMYAYNESMSINKTTMQTAIGSLQVNNVTMEAYNATMGVNNVTMEAYNGAMGVNNVAMEACNATMGVCNAAL